MVGEQRGVHRQEVTEGFRLAYRFTGFFTRPPTEPPAMLPGGAVWREITTPFAGVGVRLSVLADDRPGAAEAIRLLAEVGLGDATDWIYARYVTWAGRIESVYGLGVSGGKAFGPIHATDEGEARDAYLTLMGGFGVTPADALSFPPFVRGFWGEA